MKVGGGGIKVLDHLAGDSLYDGPLMKDEFIKDRYDFELDRKDKLTAALALPVGVLGLLGSAGVAMVRTFVFRDTTLDVLFVGIVRGRNRLRRRSREVRDANSRNSEVAR